MPFICAKEATPVFASGGEMDGCRGGRWVMGTPYKQVDSLSYLPPTIVHGIYKQKIYEQITPTKIPLNETATTPAECAALVHRDHRTATAAEYSNVGGEWCTAVFDACARTSAQITKPLVQLGQLLLLGGLTQLCVRACFVRRRGVIYDPVVQTCVFEQDLCA